MINFLDVGTYTGDEITMFLNDIKPIDYNIYGFEGYPIIFDKVSERYNSDKRIIIYNKLISNKNGIEKLYLAKSNNYEGNSIFKSKHNVDTNNYVEVESIKLSDWILDNLPNFKNETNILRFNIEGAELYMMEDLIESGLSKYIKIYLGAESGVDILKCGELVNKHQYYLNLLKKEGIIIHQYCAATNDVNIKPSKLQKLING